MHYRSVLVSGYFHLDSPALMIVIGNCELNSTCTLLFSSEYFIPAVGWDTETQWFWEVGARLWEPWLNTVNPLEMLSYTECQRLCFVCGKISNCSKQSFMGHSGGIWKTRMAHSGGIPVDKNGQRNMNIGRMAPEVSESKTNSIRRSSIRSFGQEYGLILLLFWEPVWSWIYR